MAHPFLRKKSLGQLAPDTSEGHSTLGALHKTLKVKDLTMMGIAAVIGAGIFSTIGKAAYEGGPGVIFLFVITAITCGFTALCYAEFAARVPVSGSAYTYSYVAFGELAAWIIGWALILEYAIGNIVVAISWSEYCNNVLQGLNIHLPSWMVSDPKTAAAAFDKGLHSTAAQAWATAPQIGGLKLIFNLPAFLIVVIITALAYIGIKESKRSANAMVIVKLLVLLVVVVMGLFYINSDNYVPFLPNGFTGVLAGVSAVFYAYIGFDAISTTAEECENPQRDLPRGMIYSLIICTVIYMATALVITGMVNYKEFEHVTDPLAFVFANTAPWLNKLISFSAIVATTGVLLVFQIGQPRIWMSMSRDGLLPKKFSKIHPRYKTPSFATIVTGVLVAVPALFIDANIVTDLTSIGTLFAFVLVCGGVLVLPKPGPQQKFKLPFINSRYILPILFFIFCLLYRDRISNCWQHLYQQSFQEYLFLIFVLLGAVLTILAVWRKFSLIPMLGLLCCLYLMVEIPADSWKVFLLWMAVGLTIYLLYGLRKSKLNQPTANQ
jgi:APA family basic amino acid/polyamine antiporter